MRNRDERLENKELGNGDKELRNGDEGLRNKGLENKDAE